MGVCYFLLHFHDARYCYRRDRPAIPIKECNEFFGL